MVKIKSMDYVFIVSDKKLKGSGLVRGDLMLVTGTRQVPASAKDPYLSRELLLAVRVEKGGTHQIPKETNEYKVYMIDPRNVEKLDDISSKLYSDLLLLQYGG